MRLYEIDDPTSNVIDITKRLVKKPSAIEPTSDTTTIFDNQRNAEQAASDKLNNTEREFYKKASIFASPSFLRNFKKGTNPLYALLATSDIPGSSISQSPEVIEFANNTIIKNFDKIHDLINWYINELKQARAEIIKKYNPARPEYIDRIIQGESYSYAMELNTIAQHLNK